MKKTPHSKELIMECALEAFAQAHANSIDAFRKYETEWNDTLTELKKKTPLITKDMTYAPFKTFFINKLKYLYTDKRGTTKHQANHAEVVNRISALEHGLADMSMLQDDKDERLEDLETAYHSGAQMPPNYCVPRDDRTMATENSTLGSATTYKAMMAEQRRATEQAAERQQAFEARIERMISNGANTNSKNTKSGTKGTKQYKFYCSSHGVNISHHSGNCKDKKAGHNSEATFKNKMGGSEKRSDLYMQWRNLDTGELCKYCPTGAD
jgi:hypothetical protein